MFSTWFFSVTSRVHLEVIFGWGHFGRLPVTFHHSKRLSLVIWNTWEYTEGFPPGFNQLPHGVI